jgi:hypothetical protein
LALICGRYSGGWSCPGGLILARFLFLGNRPFSAKLIIRQQKFKVAPICFISPDEKDKGVPVFMEKTTEYVSQRTKEIVLAARPVPGCPVLLPLVIQQ